MTQVSGGRAQDQGRKHRKRGDPSPATSNLLERYHEAMRADLSRLLDELTPADTGQTRLDGTPDVQALGITARSERWTLAIKLARELGAEVDGGGADDAVPARTGRRGPVKAQF